MTMTRAGPLFLLGIEGLKPSRGSVGLLKATGASGVLLLARNIESPAQTKALVSGLEQRLGRRLLVSVDHEGGWVLRFKAGLTAFPGNAALGRAGDPALARETGRRMASELSALGVGLNLAPVLDVLGGAYNPGIGIRSFGRDPALVSRLGAAFIRGLQERGVWACAKHFPGKGAAVADAHVSLPVIRLSREAVRRRHLPPFAAAVRAGVGCVMTSHVLFPALDRVPATFSRRVVTGLLRARLGFEGVIVSDDLCMGAVTGRGPLQLAALRALQAGHDLLIVAHDPSAQREAVELVERAAQDGTLPASQVSASLARVARLLDPPGRKRAPSPEAGARLARRTARASVEVASRGGLGLPLRPNGGEGLVLVPDFREVRDRFTFEGGPGGPALALRRLLSGRGRWRLRPVPVGRASLGSLPREVSASPRVLFLCFEALRFPGQRAVLEHLKRRAPGKTVALLIRGSHDLALLGPAVTAVDAHGYRLCQLEAALDLVLGGRRP